MKEKQKKSIRNRRNFEENFNNGTVSTTKCLENIGKWNCISSRLIENVHISPSKDDIFPLRWKTIYLRKNSIQSAWLTKMRKWKMAKKTKSKTFDKHLGRWCLTVGHFCDHSYRENMRIFCWFQKLWLLFDIAV